MPADPRIASAAAKLETAGGGFFDAANLITDERDAAIAQAQETTAENTRLRQQIDELSAGGSGLPTLPAGGKVTPGRYLLPRQPTGTSWIIDQGTVDVISTGSPVWPQGGALFDVRRGASLTLFGVTLDTVTPPPLTGQGKYHLPPCVALLGSLKAIRCRIGAIDTFVEALAPAADVLLDDCDADGFTSYIVYSGGAKRVTVHNCRIGEGKVETPLRATSQNAVVSEEFAVLRSVIQANPRKSALDLRHVLNPSVEFCTLRMQRVGDEYIAVRAGDSSDPGCQGLVFRGNHVYGGQLHGKAKSSGRVFGNWFHDLDATKDVPLNVDGASRLIADADTNVAYYRGAAPTKPAKGWRWEQQP